MDKIFLNGMKFYAYHGVFEAEKQLGQVFIVDATLHVDLKAAGETDDLNETVHYGMVYEAIKAEMAVPSDLLEHVAERIANKLLTAFQKIESLSIRITKQNPPIDGYYDGVGIEIERKR